MRKSSHAVYISPVMSSSNPRQSVDNHRSPVTSPSSIFQFPFPQNESPQRPDSSGRYRHTRGRGSTASSITSIGGVLDTATQSRDSIAEAGNNGLCNSVWCFVFDYLLIAAISSYRNPSPTSHHSHRSSATCSKPQYAEAPFSQGYPSSHSNQYSPRRAIVIHTLSQPSRLLI